MSLVNLSLCRHRAIATALTALLLVEGCGGGERADVVETATPASLAAGDAPVTTLAVSKAPLANVADAGPDQTVAQAETVVLRGSGSIGGLSGNQISYAWRQTAGPQVILTGPLTAQPMFKTPSVTAATILTFALTVSGNGRVATDQVAVTVSRDSPWGVAPSAALSYNPEVWLPAMAEAGVSTVRGFHSTPTLDRSTPITGAGMSAVGILQWSSGATQALPANDLPGWRRYVTAQVTRFKGRVKYWEVWNEPPNFTADRSPVSYARVVAAAYEAAKGVDPNVQIGLAAKSNHVNWLSETIAAGAADKFDFVTLHPYEVASALPQGWEGAFMGIAPGVRKMLKDRNAARADVPLWFTEIGTSAAPPAAGGVGLDMQADVLVKIYTMAIAQGVARAYWFDPSDSEGLTMGLTTAAGVKRPSWTALRSLTRYLGARPNYAGWIQPKNAYYGFVFNGPKGVVLSAWTRPGESAPLSLTSEVTALDPRNATTRQSQNPTITSAPTLLIAPPGSAQAAQWLREAAANQQAAFPWNGDHSAQSSVSLTAGAAADGVFIANPPPVSTVDNVSEFDFDGRGGPSFVLDPMFLAGMGTPIKITVVVRGHGAGDPGFNLKYESDSPISSADGNGLVSSNSGWFRITGTTFYEKSWLLANPRFIGMYGYNFRLDSDGPSHSQFSIHRVTVSKN